MSGIDKENDTQLMLNERQARLKEYYSAFLPHFMDYALVYSHHINDEDTLKRREAREKYVKIVYQLISATPDIMAHLPSMREQLGRYLKEQGLPEEKANKEALFFIDCVTGLIQADAAERHREKKRVAGIQSTVLGGLRNLLRWRQ